MNIVLQMLGYAAIVIVWPSSIASVSIVAERSYGASLGRSLSVLFAILMTAVALMAFSTLGLPE